MTGTCQNQRYLIAEELEAAIHCDSADAMSCTFEVRTETASIVNNSNTSKSILQEGRLPYVLGNKDTIPNDNASVLYETGGFVQRGDVGLFACARPSSSVYLIGIRPLRQKEIARSERCERLQW